MEQRIWGDPSVCDALLAETDKLCGVFASSARQLLFTGLHGLSGKMLLRAAALALPRFQAIRMTSRLASLAAQLVAPRGATGGASTLCELLLLYGHNEETGLLLRDCCCLAAYHLSGSVGWLAASEAPEHRDLVRLLVQRMAYEQELGWLNSIIGELVGASEALARGPGGLELLELALSQDALRIDLDGVADRLADVKAALGRAATQPIVERIMRALQDGGDAPKPRYFAPSVIQPELKYWVETRGVAPPLPPAPPPPGATKPVSTAPPPAVAAPQQPQQPVQQPAVQQQPMQQPRAAATSMLAQQQQQPAAAAVARPAIPIPVPVPVAAAAAPAVPSVSVAFQPVAAAAQQQQQQPAVAYAYQQQQQPRAAYAPQPTQYAYQQQQPQTQTQQQQAAMRPAVPAVATQYAAYQQQQQAAAAAAPAAAPASAAAPGGVRPPWSCLVCTYEHRAGEAAFLACAMCGSERPGN